MLKVRDTAREQGFGQLMFSELGPDVDEALALLRDMVIPRCSQSGSIPGGGWEIIFLCASSQHPATHLPDTKTVGLRKSDRFPIAGPHLEPAVSFSRSLAFAVSLACCSNSGFLATRSTALASCSLLSLSTCLIMLAIP